MANNSSNIDSFSSIGLLPPLVEAAEALSYINPTPVQARTIPGILAGRDIIGLADTGTGKTAAFLFPLLQRLFLDGDLPSPGEADPALFGNSAR